MYISIYTILGAGIWVVIFFFFFNDTATTEIYTLSLHDALPIFISKVAELDEDGTEKIERGKVVYKVNDHWFILNAKFVWKDAPVNRDS